MLPPIGNPEKGERGPFFRFPESFESRHLLGLCLSNLNRMNMARAQLKKGGHDKDEQSCFQEDSGFIQMRILEQESSGDSPDEQ